MRGSPLLACLVVGILVLSGCLGGDSAGTKEEPNKARGLTGKGGAQPYPVPTFPIMDTPRSSFTKVLCDAGVCVRRLTSMQEGPAAEVMIAQDAMNPKHLIAGSKDLHADMPTCVVVSTYGSTDGGRTWVSGYPRPRVGVMGGPTGLQGRCESDPAAAFDGKGNAVMITLNTAEGLFTYQTKDVGKTWKEVGMAFKGGNDKNWAATDFRINRIYSITRATCQRGEAITYSDNGGDSWEGPFCFASGQMDFAQVDVGPDGSVYAIGAGQGGMAFAKSIDGGRNWTPAQSIAIAPGGVGTQPGAGGALYRTPRLPDMAVSLGTGAIMATWHQDFGGQTDIVFTQSLDGGNTWSKPIKVNDDSAPVSQLAAVQYIPAVAASPAGDVHVLWFDARHDPSGKGHLLDLYYAHSLDGEKFEKNIRVTPQSFVPYTSRHQQQPFFIGDYIGLTASNTEAVGVFPLTVNGRAEIHAAILGG